jgi:hypothetical protein
MDRLSVTPRLRPGKRNLEKDVVRSVAASEQVVPERLEVPSDGVLRYPTVLIIVRHVASEVRVEPPVAAESANNVSALSPVELLPSDLGDHLVAEGLPGDLDRRAAVVDLQSEWHWVDELIAADVDQPEVGRLPRATISRKPRAATA